MNELYTLTHVDTGLSIKVTLGKDDNHGLDMTLKTLNVQVDRTRNPQKYQNSETNPRRISSKLKTP